MELLDISPAQQPGTQFYLLRCNNKECEGLRHGDSRDGGGVATGLLIPNSDCQPKVRSGDQLYRYNGRV